MKPLYLLFISIFFISKSFSQIKKGNWEVSAQISNINYNITLKDFSFKLSPGGQYFVSNRVAIGGQLGFIYSSASNILSLGFAPTSKQYLILNETGGFFLQEYIGYFYAKNAAGGSSNALGFGIAPGYSFILNKHITLDLGIGWSAFYNLTASTLTSNNIGLNTGLSIYFGDNK